MLISFFRGNSLFTANIEIRCYFLSTLTFISCCQKSKDFLKANCFDKNSKLFLQLDNGKIITLLHLDQESCGTMV